MNSKTDVDVKDVIIVMDDESWWLGAIKLRADPRAKDNGLGD